MIQQYEGYQLEGVLGQVWAKVYRATDSTGRAVAIKAWPAPANADSALVRLAEAQQWTHPCLLPLLDYGLAGGELYTITPLMAGGSLWPYVMTGRPTATLPQVVGWADRIAEGLDYLHGQGVVHQRLSYNNILFDEAGQPLLADSYMHWLTYRGPDYLPMRPLALNAPETFGGVWLPPSDQYSLAMLIYELLTGVLPFENDAFSPSEMIHHLLNSPVTPISTYRPDLAALDGVLERALAKNPAERFESIRIVARGLVVTV